MLRPLRNSLLSLLYPQECRVCSAQVENADGGVACAECWDATRLFGGGETLCSKCGAYLARAIEAGHRCLACNDHHYDRAAAAGIYEKALAATVVDLKSVPYISYHAKAAFLEALDRAHLADVSLIIPVPLSRRRLIERGFNQAEILAAIAARHLGRPLDRHSLVRKIHSPIHRVAMDKKARELTVRNAFDVTRPKLVEGQSILLVDDVFTSGSTSSYCSKVLKKNGAAGVQVVTLARAVISD